MARLRLLRQHRFQRLTLDPMILPTFFFTRLCLDCLGTRFHEIRFPAIVLLPEFLFHILAFKSLQSLLTKEKIFQFTSETITIPRVTRKSGLSEN